MSALQELINFSADILFVQWTGLNRLWLYPGPETELFLSHTIDSDYKYRTITYSKNELQKFSTQYSILNHDYHNLMVLIDYCNILKKISGNTKIFFINGLIPWTEEICNINTIDNYYKNLSDYTKKLLDFDRYKKEIIDSLILSFYP